MYLWSEPKFTSKSDEIQDMLFYKLLPHKVSKLTVQGEEYNFEVYRDITDKFFDQICLYIKNHVQHILEFKKYRLSSGQLNKLLAH